MSFRRLIHRNSIDWYNQMAAEEELVGENRLCQVCEQHSASYFCLCNAEKSLFCDQCVLIHPQTSTQPHLPLAIDYFGQANAEFRKKWADLAKIRQISDSQLEEILDRKEQFKAEVEMFGRKLQKYQETIESSFAYLHRSLKSSVEVGFEEAKEKLGEAAPVYSKGVTQRLLTGKMRLLEWKTDFAQTFEQMIKNLKDSKVVIEVDCPGISDQFQEEYFELVRKEADRSQFQQNSVSSDMSHFEVDGSYRPFEENGVRLRIRNCLANMGRKEKVSLGVVVLLVLTAAVGMSVSLMLGGAEDTLSDHKGKELVFADPVSSELLRNLGEYKGGNSAAKLLMYGPVELENGFYQGQWDPSDFDNAAQEQHVSGYGVMAYSNGDIYEGYFREGKRHGNGRLITGTGHVFEGVWKDGEFTGWGICRFSDGSIYSGQWEEGRLQGFGVLTQRSVRLIGEFEGDQVNGVGLKYVSADNFAVGTWKLGKLQGRGLEFKEGNIHWGNFESGKLTGSASSVEISGIAYIGKWRDGVKQGEGVETYPAEIFTGAWTMGEKTTGAYNYTDQYRLNYESLLNSWSGRNNDPTRLSNLPREETWLMSVGPVNDYARLYQGQINSRWQRHGFGVQNYTDGSSYVGCWCNGTRHGQGRLLTAEGEVWEGVWTAEQFTGWGSRQLTGGTIQIGQWEAGLLQGVGYVREKNKVTVGEFQSGLIHGIGLQFVSDFELTVGKWSRGTPTGYGFLLQEYLVRWGYYEAGQLIETAASPIAVRIERCPSFVFGPVNSSGKDIEAISFRIDRSAYLTSVCLGNSHAIGAVAVMEIQILLGNSTAGAAVYSHSKHAALTKVKEGNSCFRVPLSSPLVLKPNTLYTLRAVYQSNSVSDLCTKVVNEISKEGLNVHFASAVYENGEISKFNQMSAGPLCGLDFLLIRD